MKHLKTFESKQTTQDIKYKIEDFLSKFEKSLKNYQGRNYIDNMNYYNIPNEFEYEFAVLYFLYSDSHTYTTNWKQGDYTDNYIKRQVKNYIQKLILKKFNDNPNLYFKLKNVFDKRKNIGMPREAVPKYIFSNFQSALKNAPEHLDISTKYNL